MSILYPPVYGIAQGAYPKYGPKALRYMLDLTSGYTKASPLAFDISFQVQNDGIEFLQSVAIDNTQNNSELVLIVNQTGHRIVCPRLSQGFFGLVGPTGPLHMTAWGPAAIFNLLFMNMPFAPSIYTMPGQVP